MTKSLDELMKGLVGRPVSSVSKTLTAEYMELLKKELEGLAAAGKIGPGSEVRMSEALYVPADFLARGGFRDLIRAARHGLTAKPIDPGPGIVPKVVDLACKTAKVSIANPGVLGCWPCAWYACPAWLQFGSLHDRWLAAEAAWRLGGDGRQHGHIIADVAFRLVKPAEFVTLELEVGKK